MNAIHPGGHPWQLGASESAALLRAGRLASVELVESVLERMRSCNQAVNAIVAQVDAASLLAQASAADRRHAAGNPAGALDGIPLTVKDNLWVQGLPATWGVEALATFVPDHDEPVVARVREAGAIVLGKTNVPPMALAATTGNGVYGPTCNPLAPAMTPGGSSGGAGAALALGMGALALATDAGGSIRRPAAYTGTVGFKPSTGAVLSSSGFPRTSLDFQVVGPMARSVEDCALLATMIAVDASRFPGQGQAARPEVWLRERARARRARIVAIVPPDQGQEPVVTAALNECVERLARAGHRVAWQPMPYSVAQVDAFWLEIIPHGVRAAVDELGLDESALPAALRDLARRSSEPSAVDVYRTIARLLDWRQRTRALWAEADVVLSPASPCLAWPLDAPYPASIDGCQASPRAGALYATFANAAGAPSISVPVPWHPGIGMQLTGAPGDDAQLLAWAWECEQAMLA
ncbi:MAG: amidase [Alcaligenaceae bacterium]|nr:amidase [Alcaligenaceae bacterium SAGV5]MPS53645.1 amidase [Alcaligenaceae bacterium SAGV3]MPT59284.1 amidase [Alcaligenaceae bacterium]